MSNFWPAGISISCGVANSFIDYKDQAEKDTVSWYQSALKAPIWLVIHECHDLAYPGGVPSRFFSRPLLKPDELVKHVSSYVSSEFATTKLDQ